MLPDIENEARLEWHEDPFRYPYLRETWVMKPSRSRPVARDAFGAGKRVVGYAVLREDTPPSSVSPWGRTFWHRRVWWLYEDDAGMPNDRGAYGPVTGVYPVEAVSPQSIRTARPSVFINERPSVADLEGEDPRLRCLLEWLARKGGKASLREVRRAKVPGLGSTREVLTAAGRLAELSWCWLREERRGRTGQRSFVIELIDLR
ncbi:MAG: hypothetical protein XD63_0649 [Thermoanaerobacterales bacterium 50_218]|nr:MAG: hypothetical protein XD63_0649 [Thermoanaerobacterales bacterium 50_218]